MCNQGKYTAFMFNVSFVICPKYNALEARMAKHASQTEQKLVETHAPLDISSVYT
jgi:hypothetical protein